MLKTILNNIGIVRFNPSIRIRFDKQFSRSQMNSSKTFTQITSRALFILIIFLAVFGPRLSTENPGPILKSIKSIPILVWMILFLIFLLIVWLQQNMKQASLELETHDVGFNLQIDKAVKIENGGNGLASAPFSPLLKWLNLFGWIEVKDYEKECVVIDGTLIIQKTQFFFAPMRLLGKPMNARRVLLHPSPLVDIKGDALTSDRYDLSLIVSVKYSVIDPCYVASLSEPLSELIDTIKGKIVEEIHGNELLEIIKDEGELCQELNRQLKQTQVVKNHYDIEVIKAEPTGNAKIIEIIRQKREELARKELYEQEGENKRIIARHDLEIDRLRAELDDEFTNREFRRQKEILKLSSEYEILREMTRAIAQIAASGLNPSSAIKEIRSLFTDERIVEVQSLPEPTSRNLIEIEQENLENMCEKVGIISFDVQPDSEAFNRPGEATIHFEEFSIEIVCPPEYPTNSPYVYVRNNEDVLEEIIIPWYSGSNLCDATTSALLKVRAANKTR